MSIRTYDIIVRGYLGGLGLLDVLEQHIIVKYLNYSKIIKRNYS